jgi:hypothetical protein
MYAGRSGSQIQNVLQTSLPKMERSVKQAVIDGY